MFLEKQKENHEGEMQEDLVQATMKLWKTLTPQEKKEWNEKAKGGETASVNQPLNNNNNNDNTENNKKTTINNTDNKQTEQLQQTKQQKPSSFKNKLSNFAFQKTAQS